MGDLGTSVVKPREITDQELSSTRETPFEKWHCTNGRRWFSAPWLAVMSQDIISNSGNSAYQLRASSAPGMSLSQVSTSVIWVSNATSSESLSTRCQLQSGPCHLPLQGWNHLLPQLLIFNTSWKKRRIESRNEALSALGKTGRTFLQIDIFRSDFMSSVIVSPHV